MFTQDAISAMPADSSARPPHTLTDSTGRVKVALYCAHGVRSTPFLSALCTIATLLRTVCLFACSSASSRKQRTSEFASLRAGLGRSLCLQRALLAVQPPSTGMTAPLRQLELGQTRNATTSTFSCGCAGLASGVSFRISSNEMPCSGAPAAETHVGRVEGCATEGAHAAGAAASPSSTSAIPAQGALRGTARAQRSTPH